MKIHRHHKILILSAQFKRMCPGQGCLLFIFLRHIRVIVPNLPSQTRHRPWNQTHSLLLSISAAARTLQAAPRSPNRYCSFSQALHRPAGSARRAETRSSTPCSRILARDAGGRANAMASLGGCLASIRRRVPNVMCSSLHLLATD